MCDDVDPLEEHRLYCGLPRPQRKWVIAQWRIVGIEHQRGTRVRMAKEVRMKHGAIFSSVRLASNTAPPACRTIPVACHAAGPWRETGGQSPSFRLRPRMPTRGDDGMTPQVTNHRQESRMSPLAWS